MTLKLQFLTVLGLSAALATSAAAQQPAAQQAKPATTAAKPATAAAKPATTTTARPATRSTATHRFTKEEITEVQQGLTKAGFFKGKVTGAWNSESARALREYQKANHMAQTGHLTEDLVTRLKPQT